MSGLGAAALDGPLAIPRGETIITASSFDQARIAFDHILAFMGDKLEDRKRWRVWDTAQQARILNRENGASVKCLGSDPRRAHGLAPVLILADEPAQWPTTGERMLAALRTAAGKQPSCRFVALGTRPADESHWFQSMLDGGASYSQCHAAREGDAPFQRRTWARANPSLDAMPDLERAIRAEAQEARRDPSMLSTFAALRLNQGVSDVQQSTLLDASTWARLEGSADLAGPYALGIDLGSSAAMSAAAAFFPDSGAFDVLAAFPRIPSLAERGLLDGVGRRYLDMAARGELIVAGEHESDPRLLLGEALRRWGRPAAIICDRWREAALRDALQAAGIPPATLILRGQGYKDGGEDVRDFRSACLNGRVIPAPSLLARSAMGEARVVTDPAGNQKLAKNANGGRRLRARDDAAAAGILAVAAGMRQYRAPQRSGVYVGRA